MNPRLEAVQKAGKKTRRVPEADEIRHSVQFASRVFHIRLMEQTLPKKVFLNLSAAMVGKEKFDPQNSDLVAEAIKTWAMQHGATHYTHWFQPLTGAVAEKHDSFLSWNANGSVIEQFRGKDLLRGEPDASSFPSGGLRSTHAARGITMWDPSSPPFLWEGGDGLTLCIPTVYFSWKGEPLDQKIPLLRSDAKIQETSLRLLKMCGIPAERVFSTLGPEQEYFAIDRSLFLLRPDLMLGGRTVFGSPPAKGQELEDHYFGAVKDRILGFMREFEDAALRLGIPVKTRHNEVAPAQHEIAPLFERASLAVDHNLLLMELMRQIAIKHDLACLLHEKPFAAINGSGKHCNWSLATDTGLNLLDPQENSLAFLTILTAIIHAVHEHAGLLRASIASAGNDHRLGGSEAPPTIISIYLGESLERIVEQILTQKSESPQMLRLIDLGLAHIPHHEADPSDRNRTSFFAFTGNKFEFRAVGAEAHCAFPIMIINAIVSDSLALILDEIGDAIGTQKDLSSDKLFALSLPVLRKHLLRAKPILFSGNGYSLEWEKEAEQRGLPNIKRSFHALSQLLEKKTLRAFVGILTEKELHSRYEILLEQYAKSMNIEANLMIELFRTQILPAALLDQKNRAKALTSLSAVPIKADPHQIESLKTLSSLIGQAIAAIDEVEKVQRQTLDLGWEAKGRVFCEIAAPKMDQARALVDQLEKLVDNALWPLPKYRELLYLI
jgi:glutamine synthetase